MLKMSYILDFNDTYIYVMLSPTKEVTHMLSENEFINLYIDADNEIKNQIELVLTESQQHSELED